MLQARRHTGVAQPDARTRQRPPGDRAADPPCDIKQTATAKAWRSGEKAVGEPMRLPLRCNGLRRSATLLLDLRRREDAGHKAVQPLKVVSHCVELGLLGHRVDRRRVDRRRKARVVGNPCRDHTTPGPSHKAATEAQSHMVAHQVVGIDAFLDPCGGAAGHDKRRRRIAPRPVMRETVSSPRRPTSSRNCRLVHEQ